MARVLVTARIENMEDLNALRLGVLRPDQVRAVEIADAVVGSDAVILSLPSRLIAQLGFDPIGWQSTHTRVYGMAKLTIQGRECVTDVAQVPGDSPVLIGTTSCLAMDWVVDPKTNTLVGNPAHGGEQMYEIFVSSYGELNPAS